MCPLIGRMNLTMAFILAGNLQAASQTHREEKARPDKRVHRSVERFITGAPETHGKFMHAGAGRDNRIHCFKVACTTKWSFSGIASYALSASAVRE